MLVLGTVASQNTKSFLGEFDSIQTVTVGSGGSSTVTFSSIPATYTHLQIRAISKDSRVIANSSLNMRFNGDTGSNYSEHGVTADLTYGVSSYGVANSSSLGIGNTSGNVNANVYGVQIIDILDYANTNKFKTVRILGGHEQFGNGPSYIGLFSGAWRNTSAINSITIIPLVANILQHSTFALYGIK